MNDSVQRERQNSAVRSPAVWAIPAVAGGCLAVLVLSLFGELLIGNRQLAFRDSVQSYYPLYLKVQQEWAAGRWPLWMPEINGGTPLLGNPISAVFYPGKLVYAVLPYAWAARMYVIFHVLFAFTSMVVLLRSWGTSGAGAALGGLSYAFAAPVLFQWANVIFLVGAAWMPLGLCAMDRWLRQGKARGVVELAMVLSMQLLGGDWESAYLIGAIGAAYCLGLRCQWLRLIDWLLALGVAAAFYAAQLWLTSRSLAAMQTGTLAGSDATVGYWLAAKAVLILGWGLLIVIAVRCGRGRGDENLGSRPLRAPIGVVARIISPLISGGRRGSGRAGGAGRPTTEDYGAGTRPGIPPHPPHAPGTSPDPSPPTSYRDLSPKGRGGGDLAGRGPNEMSGEGLPEASVRSRPFNTPGLGLLKGLAGLVAAGLLALALTAVQVWPVLEFASRSLRAAESEIGFKGIYGFSLRPIRLLEWLWPNVSGTFDRGNRCWIGSDPRRSSEEFWVPSVYAGSLALVLAVASAGIRRGPSVRGLLTALAVVGILGSLGEYSSPRYWARQRSATEVAGARREPLLVDPDAPGRSVPATASQEPAVANDDHDGDGGFYWFLTVALPGFGSFRYPGKLLTIASLGLAGLAALGWDELVQRRSRRAWWCATSGLFLSLGAVCFVMIWSTTVRAYLQSRAGSAASAFGPFDVSGAFSDLRTAVLQAWIVLAVSLGLFRLARVRPRTAGALALVLATFDLAGADSRIIWSVPQTVFQERPRMLELIEVAEQVDPAPGPYRIRRMEAWRPMDWFVQSSASRFEEMARWERDTLVSLSGVPFGPQFTCVLGSADLLDYVLFFAPSRQTADRRTALAAGLRPGEPYVSYPRQSFDLWNTRYFIVPARLNAADVHRGFASLLPDAKVLYPDFKAFEGPGGGKRRNNWYSREDMVLLLNKSAFPRAWVVHRGKFTKPIVGMNPMARRPLLKRLTSSAADHDLTTQNDQPEGNLRQMAWIETDHPERLARYVAGGESQSRETVAVETLEPQRVVLTANLMSPGVVILADVYYPGWELTIDGRDAEILRVNRMMRGAAVEAGSHRLTYIYRPRSFRWGMMVSLSALLIVVIMAALQLAMNRSDKALRLKHS